MSTTYVVSLEQNCRVSFVLCQKILMRMFEPRKKEFIGLFLKTEAQSLQPGLFRQDMDLILPANPAASKTLK